MYVYMPEYKTFAEVHIRTIRQFPDLLNTHPHTSHSYKHHVLHTDNNMNLNLTRREVTDAVPPKTAIRSGDMFCILRLDGLDPIILWGTGMLALFF